VQNITVEPAFDNQSPRPSSSSQVPSAGIASHTSETSTRPPTKYDPFSQPVQDSRSSAVPDDADDDFNLEVDEQTSLPETLIPVKSAQKKFKLSKEGREKFDSLEIYDKNKPSNPALRRHSTFAPADNQHMSTRRRDNTQAQPNRQQGRNKGPAELIQVRTPAEKQHDKLQKDYAKAIGPQNYS
jgi:hypothetical protein